MRFFNVMAFTMIIVEWAPLGHGVEMWWYALQIVIMVAFAGYAAQEKWFHEDSMAGSVLAVGLAMAVTWGLSKLFDWWRLRRAKLPLDQ